MRTLFIHIGYGKTGTTFLQNYFYNNNTVEGLYYPKTYNHERHLYLTSINKPTFCQENWVKLCDEIKDLNDDILISSEEFIYDEKLHDNFLKIKNIFRSFKIKIVVTLDIYINNIRDGGSIIPKKITLLIWLICVYMAM